MMEHSIATCIPVLDHLIRYAKIVFGLRNEAGVWPMLNINNGVPYARINFLECLTAIDKLVERVRVQRTTAVNNTQRWR